MVEYPPLSDPAGDHGAVAAQPEQPALRLHPAAGRGGGRLLGRRGCPLQRRLGRHEDEEQGRSTPRHTALRYKGERGVGCRGGNFEHGTTKFWDN